MASRRLAMICACHSRAIDMAAMTRRQRMRAIPTRSEEHTSELQSRENLVCRLLLEKKHGAGHRAEGTRARRAHLRPGPAYLDRAGGPTREAALRRYRRGGRHARRGLRRRARGREVL